MNFGGHWVPVATDLARKPKVLRIARATGRSRHEVVGLLVDLWGWASNESTDGSLPGLTVDALVDAIEADESFWRAVMEVGWLEELPGERPGEVGGLAIPRADEWITKGAKARLQKNMRQQRWREGKVNGVDDNVDAGASTGPSTREEKRRRTPPTPLGGGRKKADTDTEPEGFAEFWSAYPRKVKKAAAQKAWAKLKPDADLQAVILAAVAAWKASDQWTREEGRFVPHASTWLNGSQWKDELPKGEDPGPTFAEKVARRREEAARRAREKEAQSQAAGLPVPSRNGTGGQADD